MLKSEMKKIAITLLLLIIPAVVFAAPSIRFETEQHDFGEVRQGDLPSFTFKFVNTGDADLVIKEIITT